MADPVQEKSRFWRVVGRVGAVAGALSLIPIVAAGVLWVPKAWESFTTVDLPATFPGESWREADAKDFAWLQDDWCYTSLPNFHTQFRVVDGELQRRNWSDDARPVDTGWISTRVYKSNRGLLRIWHDREGFSGSYIHFDPAQTGYWWENERTLDDAGNVVAGAKRQVLSCRRCKISRDGMTFSCGARSNT